MRRFLSILTVSLILTGAASGTSLAGTVVNSFNCLPPLPKDRTIPNYPSDQEIVAMASQCVARNTMVDPSLKLFDDIAGVDPSGCLTATPAAISTQQSYTLTPRCCIIQTPTGVSLMRCDMIAQ